MKLATFPVYLLPLLLLILGTGCKKDEPVHDPTIPLMIPQELKDYMYFLPGTYWVYRDSISGIEDSVYVTSAAAGIDTVYDSDGKIDGIWEWFSVDSKSDLDGYDYYYGCSSSFAVGCGNVPKSHCYHVTRTKSKIGDYAGETFVFLYPPFINDITYTYTNVSTVITITAIIDELIIGGKHYNDVVVINDSKNITENDQETNFYIVQNYGVIRKVKVTDGKAWDLIRYNIDQ